MDINTRVSDLRLIDCFCSRDARGEFIKPFNYAEFFSKELGMDIKEIYYSKSGRDVIRGMHFQVPPMDHEKLVHVLKGNVLDVAVDLRKGSKDYGRVFTFELSGDMPQALFIPRGFAHGFKSLSDDSWMLYMVSSGYSKEHDAGIRYDSIGLDWGLEHPTVSERDKSFPELKNFVSPFGGEKV